MKKDLPIGISDFKEIITENYVYVDKSLLIKELIEVRPKVALIPRMRRFGKTLNLSMLRYFFEKTGEDTSYLFTSLNIWKEEKYRAMQGQYPVIFFTLKDLKQKTWQETYSALSLLISQEFDRHLYLLEGEVLTDKEKEDFHQIRYNKATNAHYEQSLRLLSMWLSRYHGKKVVLLVDEYDSPVHAAFVHGFYDDCILFLRNWLSAALKDTTCLEFSVITGILRVTKESIFSGLNNLEIFTLLSESFQDKFGLTEAEVEALLKEYDLSEKLPEIRTWYDGYRIGSTNGIYNPWSLINCIKNNGKLAPYWVNTSDNALIRQLITRGPYELKEDLEELLRGGTVDKKIEEGIVFSNLETNLNTIWSLLFFSGYLTHSETYSYGKPTTLKIPNAEVREVYESFVASWFEEGLYATKYRLFLESLKKGDVAKFSELLQDLVLTTFSMFDVTQSEPEKVYHAFVLGMLLGLKSTHEVKSNRESGLGRYDVILFPKNSNDLGIIMEFKKVRRPYEKIDKEIAAELALNQIEDKKYAQELIEKGVKKILLLGIAFEGKNTCVRAKQI